MNDAPHRLLIILAFAAIYIIWGSTYIAILIGLTAIPPFLLAGGRFLIAGLFLLVWCWWRGESMPTLLSMGRNTLYGILMLFGGTVSVTWAEQYIPSSVAAIIVTALPFWFVLLDKKQWRFYFSNKFILAGLLVGFIGVVILMGHQASLAQATSHSQYRVLAAFVILIGSMAWAVGSLLAKYQPTGSSVMVNASVQLLMAGFFCTVISLLAREWDHFSLAAIPVNALSAWLYLMLMGSVVAYLSYLWLLEVCPPAQVSTYVYVNPVVALLLGMALANETLTWPKLTALLIILVGVLLVNIPKYRSQPAKVPQ